MPVLAGLGGEFPSDDALLNQSDIISLFQGEQFPDFVGSLGAESSGDVDISESRDIGCALLRDGDGNDGHVVAHDAASNGPSGPLAGPSGSVALLILVKQKSDSALRIMELP